MGGDKIGAKSCIQRTYEINKNLHGPDDSETIEAQNYLKDFEDVTSPEDTSTTIEEATIQTLIKRLDLDRSGRISVGDFTKIVTELCPNVDVNVSEIVAHITAVGADGT